MDLCAQCLPDLSAPTAVDVTGARVLSLDVEEIAARGVFSAWEASVALMLARQVAVAHFYLHENQIGDWPPLYQPYQRQRILELRAQHKRICLDEMHRLRGGAAATMAQLETDALESRKHGVEMAFCSPLFDHFPTAFCKWPPPGSCWGLGRGGRSHRRTFSASIPPNGGPCGQHLHGPTPDGAPMLVSVDTSRGRFTQLVILTTGVQSVGP